MRLQVILVWLILVGCSRSADHSAPAENNLICSDNYFTYGIATELIEPVGPGDSTIKTINIYDMKLHTLVQQIIPPENSYITDLPSPDIFIVEDINFDGRNDFRIIQSVPATNPNIYYHYWVFNPASSQFVQDTTVNVPSPEFDQKNKKITSRWRSGCCSSGYNVFQYDQGHLKLVESLEENVKITVDSIEFVRKKLVGGAMKVIQRGSKPLEKTPK